MTLAELTKTPHHLMLSCISGSKAYNLDLPGSDTDIKGIFVLPQKALYGFEQVPQVANDTQDVVYFELGRFMALLTRNNPNILELLNSPARAVLYRHPLMDLIKPEDFLSKLCYDAFAGYAKTQVKKASGLNKKINRPFEKERKGILDFCYVIEGNSSVGLLSWLLKRDWKPEECGLSGIAHFRDTYGLYHRSQHPEVSFRGITSRPEANDISLSTVPKGLLPLTLLQFNKDAYSIYCRDYNEYWQWVNKRNEGRFQQTMLHGKQYDSKNMMHTFRLLNMAEEIARTKQVIVHRPDREFLLQIRRGEWEWDDLLRMIEEKMNRIELLYQQSDLPEKPDETKAEALLINMREQFYAQ